MLKKTAKTLLCLFLALCTVSALLTFGAAAAAGSGDADNDGRVTAADARLALRCSVGLETLGSSAKAAADMDGDGRVTAEDARRILRKSVGLPPEGQLTEKDLPADAKILYLTFDDGPSARTAEVLDILDRYNAKATFFVVNGYSYNYMYKEVVDRGHSIGLHSYTHEYSDIYRNTDAYFNDLNKISDAVYNVAGVRTNLIRFPGGSSNTVSRSYCRGIMSVLTKEVDRRGYVYFDWNSDNGDATGVTMTAYEMYQTAVAYAGPSRLVMLMHDASYKGTTVKALPMIIEYYQSHGYYLIGLNENSPTAHHYVSN